MTSGALAKRDDVELRVVLLGDAVACAVAGQQLAEGHYHLDRMLKPLVRRGEVGAAEPISTPAACATSNSSRELATRRSKS